MILKTIFNMYCYTMGAKELSTGFQTIDKIVARYKKTIRHYVPPVGRSGGETWVYLHNGC